MRISFAGWQRIIIGVVYVDHGAPLVVVVGANIVNGLCTCQPFENVAQRLTGVNNCSRETEAEK